MGVLERFGWAYRERATLKVFVVQRDEGDAFTLREPCVDRIGAAEPQSIRNA